MSNIDKIDLKIIELLQDNGNLPSTTIARALNVSEATVRRRRERLEYDEVLRVVGVVNPFKIGFRIMVIFGLQIEKNRLKEVEQTLVAMPEVRFLGVTIGKYDLMLEAWFKSNEDLLHFATETLGHITGIRNTEEFQIMRLSKYAYDWGQPTAAKQALRAEY